MLRRKRKDLSVFDNKKIIYENVELILTRKCNLSCAHCMRGDSQNVQMSRQTIESFFNNVSEIGGLSLGGGEPSLAHNVLKNLVDVIIEKDVKIGSVNFTTNGILYNEKFANELLRLKSTCEAFRKNNELIIQSEENPVVLRISLDDFHLKQLESQGYSLEQVLDNAKKYQELLGENSVYSTYVCDYDIWKEGKAKNIETDIPKINNVLKNQLAYYEGKERIIVGPLVTIGATGEFIPANIAFNKEEVLSAGNVNVDHISTILQRIKFTRCSSIDQYNDKVMKLFSPMGVNEKNVKRVKKTERFTKRLAIEKKLKMRNQKLPEDYDFYRFE